MPAIKNDLYVSHSEAGAIFLLISMGYFIALLGSGFFSSRLMHRKTIILSAITVGMALLGVALSNNIWGIRAVTFLLGMAAGLYLPSGIATLTSLTRSRDWGKAIAIHELAPNLGFVLAPLASEALLLLFSWRSILSILGCSSILVGIAFARFGKGGDFPGEAPSFESLRTLFTEPSFWIMIILFGLGIAGSVGIYTMLPLYLVTQHGLCRSRANTLISLSRISGLGIAFLAGWINDRLGPRRTIWIVFLLTGLATILLGISSNFLIIIIVFLQPLLAACFFPSGFAALSSIGPPSARNMAVSFTVPGAFIVGAGLIPAGIGLMGDAGYFNLGIAFVGGLILAGSFLSLCLKLPK